MAAIACCRGSGYAEYSCRILNPCPLRHVRGARAWRRNRVMLSAPSVTLQNSVVNRERTFEGLLQEYKNRIHGYVCRLTNDSPDAEDITQEVFIRAYQSMHAFRHDAAVDTWLYRIATNLVIDRFRREKRAPQWVSVQSDADDTEIGRASCRERVWTQGAS